METGRFWPISALLGPEMVKFAWNFCYCAVNQEKAVFQWKRAVSGPSALLGLEMVKYAPNFCYCAVDQEKAVFQWKRAVSGPSALLGPKMVKFGVNFCYCAVDQEKAVFQWKRAVSGPSAFLGPQMVKFGVNFCRRPRKGRFSMETGRFWLICPFGARNGKICNGNGPFLAHLPFWGPKW